MRLRILSDLHLEFEDWSPPPVQADLVVMAGDIYKRNRGVPWMLRHFPNVPVVYVAGNHEFYGSNISGVLKKIQDSVAGTEIHFLQDQSFEFQDVVFLGSTLWTDFNLFGCPDTAGPAVCSGMNDYRQIRVAPEYRRLKGRDTVGFHRCSRRWLEGELVRLAGRKVVVVSHHAPSAQSLQPSFSSQKLAAGYASHLDDLIRTSGARLWIHGHTHHSVDYRLGNTQVISNQKGYPDQAGTGFRPDLTVEI